MTSTREIPVIIGLDIGGTRIKAVALSTPSHEIVEQYEGPSGAKVGVQAVHDACLSAVEALKKLPYKIEGVGVGCAGSIEPDTGVVRNSPNFVGWKNVPLGSQLREDLKVPVIVDNDANCAAYAEWCLGNGQGARNMVLLTLGTGIGGGLILNRRLYRGSTGTGGELGHLSIRADGVKCPCGNTGCFERYCSASALRERASNYTAREIFSRASEAPFAALVDEFLDNFKIGLTSIANIFDPDFILIGGGVAKGVAHYFPKLEAWLKEHAFPAVGASVKLRVTRFGNLSGAIGAALLCEER